MTGEPEHVYHVEFRFHVIARGLSPHHTLTPPVHLAGSVMSALIDCPHMHAGRIDYLITVTVVLCITSPAVLDAHYKAMRILSETLQPCFDHDRYGITIETCTIRQA